MALNQNQRRLLWKLLRAGPTEKTARVIERLEPAEVLDMLEQGGPTEHGVLVWELFDPKRIRTTLRNIPSCAETRPMEDQGPFSQNLGIVPDRRCSHRAHGGVPDRRLTSSGRAGRRRAGGGA